MFFFEVIKTCVADDDILEEVVVRHGRYGVEAVKATSLELFSVRAFPLLCEEGRK